MPKRILILNVGSSSVKYSLYKNDSFITKQTIEKIGERNSRIQTYAQAIDLIFKKVGDVDIIGHRVVHGGAVTKPTLITSNLIRHLEEISSLAPLHNAPELHVIKYCLNNYKHIKQIALFDTYFFRDLPRKSSIYPIPKSITEKYHIRRYGFHGESHNYMLEKAKKILGKPNPNLITCHLGNGCSITAIEKGKPVDTSMGFTPMDGVVMGTRSGSIDPGIIFFLGRQGCLMSEIEFMLNDKSGLLGISNYSKDARELQKSSSKDSKLALDIFTYSIAKQISAYAGIIGKVDAIIFTAGIGQNEARIRKMILNQIKTRSIKKKVLVIPTDEAHIMLRDILRVIRQNPFN